MRSLRRRLAALNSTIVRAFLRVALRPVFRTLGVVAPQAAAALADRLFFGPPRAPRPRDSRRLGRPLDVALDGRRLAAWSVGSGPRVVLFHGWGGRAAQLDAFVEPLVRAGFEVVLLDAPAHGGSEGDRSSLVEFARALAVVAPGGALHGVVAHSFGGSATALAVADGLRVERAVLIGSPARPLEWLDRFAREFAVPGPVMAAVQARTERRLGRRFDELDFVASGARLTGATLVVHDREDREVAFRNAVDLAAAWPGADLVATSGLGHRRILKDRDVVRLVVDFVGAGRAAEREPSGCPTPRCPGQGGCEVCALDVHLFAPHSRAAAPQAAF